MQASLIFKLFRNPHRWIDVLSRNWKYIGQSALRRYGHWTFKAVFNSILLFTACTHLWIFFVFPGFTSFVLGLYFGDIAVFWVQITLNCLFVGYYRCRSAEPKTFKKVTRTLQFELKHTSTAL